MREMRQNILQRVLSFASLRTIVLLVVVIFASTSVSAQVSNPFARQLRGERQIIRAGQIVKPDSVAIARADSIRVANLTDSLRKMPMDSLRLVSDSLRMTLPDSLRQTIFPDSIFAKPDSVQLSQRQLRRIERRENRTPLLSDSMALNRMCWASLAK